MQMSKRESPRGIRGERCSILSVRALVNTSTGTLAQSITYDEFGNQLSNTNPDFQPFGYVGGITDYDTDLIRFGARDYDPSIGRWTSKEPLGFGGALNWYVYCKNNPIYYIDYTGLAPKWLVPNKKIEEVKTIVDKVTGEAFNDKEMDVITDALIESLNVTDIDEALDLADIPPQTPVNMTEDQDEFVTELLDDSIDDNKKKILKLNLY
jgi:RHS repeat-associated protein